MYVRVQDEETHDGDHKRKRQSSPPVITRLRNGLTASPRCIDEDSVPSVYARSPLYTQYPLMAVRSAFWHSMWLSSEEKTAFILRCSHFTGAPKDITSQL